jgi:hypothetical protein
LLVFLGWSTPSPLSSKGFDLESKSVSNNVRSATLKVTLTPYSPGRSILYACHWFSLKPEMDHHHEAVILISFG